MLLSTLRQPELESHAINNHKTRPAPIKVVYSNPSDPTSTRTYTGYAIEAVLAEQPVIVDLSILSSSLFRTQLNLTFFGPEDFCVRLELPRPHKLDIQVQETASGAKSLTMRSVRTELTEYSSVSSPLNARLILSSLRPKQYGTSVFLLLPSAQTQPDLPPIVSYMRDYWFTLRGALRYLLLALTVLLLVFIAAAHIPNLFHLEELYSYMSNMAAQVFALLVPTFVKPRVALNLLRTIALFEFRLPRVGWLLLSASVLIPAAPSALIVYCIAMRIDYQSTLRAYLQKQQMEDLIQAIEQYPWRVDVRYIIERVSFEKRLDHKKKFRAYISEIVDQPSYEKAMTRVQSLECDYCTQQSTRGLISPLVWYASILPEAEENIESVRTKEAISVLTNSNHIQANLQRLAFETYLIEDEEMRSGVIEQLSAELDKQDVSMSTSEVAQIAADHLAGLMLEQECSAENTTRILTQFERIVKARMSAKEDELRWLRPPHKIGLFQIYKYLNGDLTGEPEWATQLRGRCNGTFFSRLKTEVYEPQKMQGFYSEEHWHFGTLGPVGSDPRGWRGFVLETLLNEDWRY